MIFSVSNRRFHMSDPYNDRADGPYEARRTGAIREREMDEFYITSEELCVKNEELCIENDEFCIRNEELCVKNEELCI